MSEFSDSSSKKDGDDNVQENGSQSEEVADRGSKRLKSQSNSSSSVFSLSAATGTASPSNESSVIRSSFWQSFMEGDLRSRVDRDYDQNTAGTSSTFSASIGSIGFNQSRVSASSSVTSHTNTTTTTATTTTTTTTRVLSSQSSGAASSSSSSAAAAAAIAAAVAAASAVPLASSELFNTNLNNPAFSLPNMPLLNDEEPPLRSPIPPRREILQLPEDDNFRYRKRRVPPSRQTLYAERDFRAEGEMQERQALAYQTANEEGGNSGGSASASSSSSASASSNIRRPLPSLTPLNDYPQPPPQLNAVSMARLRDAISGATNFAQPEYHPLPFSPSTEYPGLHPDLDMENQSIIEQQRQLLREHEQRHQQHLQLQLQQQHEEREENREEREREREQGQGQEQDDGNDVEIIGTDETGGLSQSAAKRRHGDSSSSSSSSTATAFGRGANNQRLPIVVGGGGGRGSLGRSNINSSSSVIVVGGAAAAAAATATASTSIQHREPNVIRGVMARTRYLSQRNQTTAERLPRTASEMEDYLFPPLSLSFIGTFREAREFGVLRNRWLLVNIQDYDSPRCQRLNREIWTNSHIRTILKNFFVLLQISTESNDGIRIKSFYGVPCIPFICVLDPRTGEEVLSYRRGFNFDATAFYMDLRAFLRNSPSLYPIAEKIEDDTTGLLEVLAPPITSSSSSTNTGGPSSSTSTTTTASSSSSTNSSSNRASTSAIISLIDDDNESFSSSSTTRRSDGRLSNWTPIEGVGAMTSSDRVMRILELANQQQQQQQQAAEEEEPEESPIILNDFEQPNLFSWSSGGSISSSGSGSSSTTSTASSSSDDDDDDDRGAKRKAVVDAKNKPTRHVIVIDDSENDEIVVMPTASNSTATDVAGTSGQAGQNSMANKRARFNADGDDAAADDDDDGGRRRKRRLRHRDRHRSSNKDKESRKSKSKQTKSQKNKKNKKDKRDKKEKKLKNLRRIEQAEKEEEEKNAAAATTTRNGIEMKSQSMGTAAAAVATTSKMNNNRNDEKFKTKLETNGKELSKIWGNFDDLNDEIPTIVIQIRLPNGTLSERIECKCTLTLRQFRERIENQFSEHLPTLSSSYFDGNSAYKLLTSWPRIDLLTLNDELSLAQADIKTNSIIILHTEN